MDKKTEEKLFFALGQKVSLLNKAADLTKQIEVRSRQERINLGSLPADRQILLDRVEKCNRMIASCAASLPAEPRVRLEQILAGKVPSGECNTGEAEILRDSLKCLSLVRSILAESGLAIRRIRGERNRLQSRLSELRKKEPAPGGSMFHSV